MLHKPKNGSLLKADSARIGDSSHLSRLWCEPNTVISPIGTKKRDSFEKGYENFKLGAMLQEARLRKGLTQEALALKLGTTKSYISKIENDIKEIR